MPQAHSILWFLGVFIGLWGVTLIVRGLPPGLFNMRWRRGSAPRRSRSAARASWPLMTGGAVAIAAGGVAIAFGVAVRSWLYGPGDLTLPIWQSSAMAAVAFSLSLFFWALRGEQTKSPRCPKCRYDMVGGGMVCPECGFAGEEGGDFLRPIRRQRTAVAALVLLGASPVLLLGTNYQRYGARGLAPTTVLIAGFEWLPEEVIVYQWGVDHGTLEQRALDGEMWIWQARWLRSRAKRLLLQPSSSVRTLGRSSRFCDFELTPEEGDRALARFIELFTDADPAVRAELIASADTVPLVLIERDASPVSRPQADQLRALLSDPAANVAMIAAMILVSIPEHSEAAIAEAMKHAGARSDAGVYSHAVRRIAAQTDAGREGLFALAITGDPAARRSAIAALAYSGRFCERTEAMLVRSLSDPDLSIATFAADGLRRFRGAESVEPILQAARARPALEGAELLKNIELSGLEGWAGELAEIMTRGQAPIDLAALELLVNMRASGFDVTPALGGLRSAAASDDPEIAARAAGLLEGLEEEGDAADLP